MDKTAQGLFKRNMKILLICTSLLGLQSWMWWHNSEQNFKWTINDHVQGQGVKIIRNNSKFIM
jgi:hypothetical protein